MTAEIPALMVSKDSAVFSSSGSWYQSQEEGLVLHYGTLYLYWWPLVAAPNNCRCGEAGIATISCTTRNIIMTLVCCLLCWSVSQERLSIMAVTLLV